MNVWQALGYFLREALLSLRRGWKVSLLAVLTIAVSLFVGGLFLLVTHNLQLATARWRSEARIIAYLAAGAQQADIESLSASLMARPEVTGIVRVSPEEARERLREAFPALEDIVEDPGATPLPGSLEVSTVPEADSESLQPLVEALEASSTVDLVDDDRAWLGRLDTAVALARGAGLLLGALLLAAAVFTIYSVIRLSAYLYREEIGVMRLVGATEAMIRGPFYLEGLMQGLLGGATSILALGALWLTSRSVGSGPLSAGSLTGDLVFGHFLPGTVLLLLLVLGALAGLLGASLSLQREMAGRPTDEPA
ncbi:MAG: ABC transporter permease [Thermoanaerobaculia bacterium]